MSIPTGHHSNSAGIEAVWLLYLSASESIGAENRTDDAEDILVGFVEVVVSDLV